MDLGIRGRGAMVTGASQGMGKAIARGLAREGVGVVICARRPEPLEAAAREIAAETGQRVLARPADVSKVEEIARLVGETVAALGRLDILVTNAGGPPHGFFQELGEAEWEEALAMNLLSAVRLTRAALPHMRKNRWGRIVHLTSVAALQPIPGLILSNTARAGVLGLSKSLANELGAENILVNTVCPGYTLTERQEKLARTEAERSGRPVEEIVADWAKNTALGRLARPEEIADLVIFLASERASYLTGQAIAVDGGLVKGIH